MNTMDSKSASVSTVRALRDDERLAAGDCLWGMLVALLALPFVVGLAVAVAGAIGVFLR
jgi:uncharacterized membrane protein